MPGVAGVDVGDYFRLFSVFPWTDYEIDWFLREIPCAFRMSRVARIIVPGVAHHITARGHVGRPLGPQKRGPRPKSKPAPTVDAAKRKETVRHGPP